jgi:small subunit ribosomal protein S5
MRPIFEVVGIKDIVAKIIGSTNPHNVIRAALRALQLVETPRSFAAKRGKKVSELFSSQSEKREELAEENKS